jgi:large subunit ribosomal protein L21
MAKIAVIKTGGKQYLVKEGDAIKIEKIAGEVGDKVKFATLLIGNEGKAEVGKPELGEKVEAKILEIGKSDKVSVVKYKNKTRYKRNVGHRQEFVKVEITKIA